MATSTSVLKSTDPKLSDRYSRTSMFLIYLLGPKTAEPSHPKVQVCGIARTEVEARELCRNSDFQTDLTGQYHYIRLPANVSRVEDLVHLDLDDRPRFPEFVPFDPVIRPPIHFPKPPTGTPQLPFPNVPLDSNLDTSTDH